MNNFFIILLKQNVIFMKKLILFIFICAIAIPGSSGINAQTKKKTGSKAKTTIVKEEIGEPIQEILDKNAKMTEALGDIEPSYVYQILNSQAFFGAAATVASSNPNYKLTGADKQALKDSFSKMFNAMKPGLVKYGYTQAKVNKLIDDLKTEVNKQINQLTTLRGFYM